MTDRPGRLGDMVRATPWLLEALRAARDVDPPDWLVGGGVLRDLVWDRLHGRPRPAPPRDLDLAFFDPTRLDPARDAEVERALTARLPGVPWDAKNQAAVHTWYGRVFGGQVAPLTSAADGVATWPETATAVAVRLLRGDHVQV
ncbi:MAG TPA: nucleotidyltransferase family protein, partial [Actinomycetes bacterium]|nr:nucleotidyltransferase family protein [Actinomycetes bacterium]